MRVIQHPRQTNPTLLHVDDLLRDHNGYDQAGASQVQYVAWATGCDMVPGAWPQAVTLLGHGGIARLPLRLQEGDATRADYQFLSPYSHMRVRLRVWA